MTCSCPKDAVLLTAAVDQLAEARRTAGQTNDDGKNAARVELRDEFYSGSMLTTVICPRSGKTYKIRPHHWAREIALIWLEQGECLLTEGLVDPPWGVLYEEERVTIFVSEHDLQRLVEKQAAKQEYSDQSPPVRLAEAKIEFEFKRWREQTSERLYSNGGRRHRAYEEVWRWPGYCKRTSERVSAKTARAEEV